MDTLEPPAASTPEATPQPQPQRPKQQCAFCSNPSKYTCPRCRTHTCSLACSQSHKTSTGCSGVRDKAAYIPMNKYGWGSMMDDYCFLEDVGRKVGEWGREIVKGGFEMNVRGVGSSGGVGRGMKRGRGRGRGRGSYAMRGRDRGGRGRGGKAKREMLKAQLEAREIEVELLPNGMERRKLNQSAWDPKTQTALLTIQYKFHPPTEVHSASYTVQPFTLLTHRNNLSTPLLTLVQKHILDRLNKKPANKTHTAEGSISSTSDSFPSWISSLVLPPPEDPENFTTPTFVIAAPPDPLLLARSAALLSARGQNQANAKPKAYYSLDPNEPLFKSLRGTQFVEFPLIEVWEHFNGVVVDKKTGGIRCTGEETEPRKKRRRLNPEEGRKTISGLVGEYGSDEDEEGEDDNGKDGLVRYVESEGDDDDSEAIMEQDNTVDEEIEVTDEDDEDEDVNIDPTTLLELVQQAKQEGKWVEGDDDDSDDLNEQDEEPKV